MVEVRIYDGSLWSRHRATELLINLIDRLDDSILRAIEVIR
jgi:hypothetical protein